MNRITKALTENLLAQLRRDTEQTFKTFEVVQGLEAMGGPKTGGGPHIEATGGPKTGGGPDIEAMGGPKTGGGPHYDALKALAVDLVSFSAGILTAINAHRSEWDA